MKKSDVVRFKTVQLANEFSKVLNKWLSLDEMANLRKLNATEQDSRICHSHDFCDANMAMAKALKRLYPNVNLDDVIRNSVLLDIWNESWEIARKNEFKIKIIKKEI